MDKLLTADKNTITLLKETQVYMGLSESELLEKFIRLAKGVVQERRSRTLLHYYTSRTLKRLRQDQFVFFLEECAREGLLKKYEGKYVVDWPGKACIFTCDTSLLTPPYERALEKIQRIYVDVLI